MSDAELTVCIDFKSPFAYLALEPTRALEARLCLAFDWLPASVPALARPTPERPDDDRGTRHRRIRAAYFARDLERYAQARGLALGDVHRTPDTTEASLGLLYVRKRAPRRAGEFAAFVFDEVWQRERDPGSRAVVDAALAALGEEARGFAEYAHAEGPQELAAVQRELREAGVTGVPAYLVRGDVFLGRQHLPMVERLLR